MSQLPDSVSSQINFTLDGHDEREDSPTSKTDRLPAGIKSQGHAVVYLNRHIKAFGKVLAI